MIKPWGQMLSIDLGKCDYSLLTNPKKLEEFSEKLCKEIKMVPHGKPMIDRFGYGKLEGYSMLQFIKTSTITVHLDEFGRRAFVDIFTCKKFDYEKAKKFCKNFFKAKTMKSKSWMR
jgi:S-adenosylmethionine/arginine decarboxylase-like enzyme